MTEMVIFGCFSETSEGMVKAVLNNLHRSNCLYLQAISSGVKLVKLFFVFIVNIKIKIKKMNIEMKDSNHNISLIPSPEVF